MITKFDMTSGKPTYQSERAGTIEIVSKPYELIEQAPSLQLIETASHPQPRTMPPDLASVSIDEFLGCQS